MTQLPLISICVPVYNVERWIEKCARSLFEQTYPNLEFVFVDDASTDRSMSILSGFMKKYPWLERRISCFYNEHNQGSAYTRKRAIMSAKGDYVFCADADDYLETNAIQLLYSAIKKSNKDMAEGTFIHHIGSCEQVYMAGTEDYDFRQVLRDETNNHTVPHLIRRNLLMNMDCFPPDGLDYLDDRYLMTCLRFHLQTQASVHSIVYHYVAHDNSVSSAKGDKHFRCHILFYQQVEHFLRLHNAYEQYTDILAEQKVLDKAALMLHCQDFEVRKRYADLYHEEEMRCFHLLHRSMKVVAWLVHNHFWKALWLYQHYINFREKGNRVHF